MKYSTQFLSSNLAMKYQEKTHMINQIVQYAKQI